MADATLSEAVKRGKAAEALTADEDDEDSADAADDAETALSTGKTDQADEEPPASRTVSEEGVDVSPATETGDQGQNLGYTFIPVTPAPSPAPTARPTEPITPEYVGIGEAQPAQPAQPAQYFLNPATGSYEPVQAPQPAARPAQPLTAEYVGIGAAAPVRAVSLAEQAALQQAGQYGGTRDVLTPETAEAYGLSPETGFAARGVVPPPPPPTVQPSTPAEQVALEQAARYAGETTPLTPKGVPAYPEAPREPEVRRAELVRLPTQQYGREEGLPVYPEPPAVKRAVPPPVTGALAQGPPGTNPQGTKDEPYWPKTVDQISQLPPGSEYIDPRDGSQKTVPGAAPSVAPRALSPGAAPPIQKALPAGAQVAQVAGIKPLTAQEAQEPQIDTYSNGYTPGRGNQTIRNVILHSTDGSERGDINQLTTSGKVGVQYYVTKDGRVMHFVSDADSAWQAGKDKYGNNANPYTIGIEQEHVDGKEAWPDAQVRATARTAAGILLRNPQLSLSDIVGHSDIAGERKQDPVAYPWERFRQYVAAYTGQGAGAAPGAAPQAQPTTKGANGLYQSEKPEDFLTGKVTTFATPEDIASGQDNGRGASHVGGLDTTQVAGIAIPEEALRAKYGNNYAAWRMARVDVVDSQTGKRLRVPIVDLGPRGDLSAIADMTPWLSQYFGGDRNLSVKLVDRAGPDVTKNPQLFADEQAAIKAGIDSSALVPGVAKVQFPQGYTFKPVDQASMAAAQKTAAVDQQKQQTTVSALPEANSGDIIGLYKRLNNPVEGVTDPMRQVIQNNLKPQIISLMRQKFPELRSDDEAWTKATSDVTALDVGREWITKALGYGQQFTNVMQKGVAGTDQLHVNQFLDSAIPGASEADKHAYLAKLYAMPIGQRIAEISSKLPRPQPGIPSTDPQQIVSALDRLSDPNFQKQQATDLAKAKTEMERNISSDPRLKGTVMERIVDATAQMPSFIAAMSNPTMMPLVLAQISDQVREGFHQEHPEWDDKTLEQNTARATLVQFFGQEAANALFMRGVGAALGGIESPAKRAIAQAIAGTGGAAAVTAATQAGVNIVTGQPVGAGVGEAAITGAIQGVIPGVLHGVGELRPSVRTAERAAAPEEAAPPVSPAAPERQPVRPSDILGPEVSDVTVPWYKPGPIITRATERTAFSPQELQRRVAELRTQGWTPEQLQQVIDKLQPEPDYNLRTVHLGEEAGVPLAPQVQPQVEPRYITPEQKFPSPEAQLAQLQRPQAVQPPAVPSTINLTGMGQGIGQAMRDMLWEKFQRGETTEAGGPSNILIAAAREKAAGRITNRADFDALVDAYGRFLRGQAAPGAPAAPAQSQPVKAMPFESPQAVNGSEPWVSRIANRFSAERIINGEIGPVEPGQGVTKEEMITRGMRMGPEEINQHVSNLMNNVGDPRLQAAAVRTEEARLSQRSRDASLAYEANPQNAQAKLDADNAFKDLTDFHNGPVAKLKNNWHAQGISLQGEIPVDLSSYNGLREEFLKNVGKAPDPSMEPVLRKTAQAVRDADVVNAQAMKNLGAEIDKQSARIAAVPSVDQVRNNIMARMKVEPCPT